jgi:hypothetical protein
LKSWRKYANPDVDGRFPLYCMKNEKGVDNEEWHFAGKFPGFPENRFLETALELPGALPSCFYSHGVCIHL